MSLSETGVRPINSGLDRGLLESSDADGHSISFAPRIWTLGGDGHLGPHGLYAASGSRHLPCSRIKSTKRSTASSSGMLNRTGFLPT